MGTQKMNIWLNVYLQKLHTSFQNLMLRSITYENKTNMFYAIYLGNQSSNREKPVSLFRPQRFIRLELG